MSIAEELLDIYYGVTNPEKDLESVGVIDHAGFRAFITVFGEKTAARSDLPTARPEPGGHHRQRDLRRARVRAALPGSQRPSALGSS